MSVMQDAIRATGELADGLPDSVVIGVMHPSREVAIDEACRIAVEHNRLYRHVKFTLLGPWKSGRPVIQSYGGPISAYGGPPQCSIKILSQVLPEGPPPMSAEDFEKQIEELAKVMYP
jgi:hypothetical protein